MRLLQLILCVLLLAGAGDALAVDSYRFMHVTIETPWFIFLGLLVVVLFPFILTAILHWHFATKKNESEGNEKV